jgi:ABC-type multidrug transport system fused ATPase/permease subunit
MTSTLQGLTVIHAFGEEPRFRQEFFAVMDVQSRALFYFFSVQAWSSWRLDFVSLMILTLSAMMVPAMHGSVEPGLTGLALVYANQIVGIFQACTRYVAVAPLQIQRIPRLPTHPSFANASLVCLACSSFVSSFPSACLLCLLRHSTERARRPSSCSHND